MSDTRALLRDRRAGAFWGSAPALLGGVLAALAGCACPDFDEMTVDDPAQLAPATELLAIRAAISDFARWTGEEGVCVPGVEVREELSGGYAVGTYSGPRKPILQVPGSGHSTTVHELCHAIDERRGWMSQDHTRLFPIGHIDPVLYPYRSSQVHESFARICEFGPHGLDLQGILEDRCGWELAHPGQDLILDEIYTEVAAPRRGRAPGGFSIETISLASLIGADAALVDVASGDALVWTLTNRVSGGVDPELLGTASSSSAFVVQGIDPGTGRVVAEHRFAAGSDLSDDHYRVFRLVDAAGGPALLVETAFATTARVWALDDTTGELNLLLDGADSVGGFPNGLLSVRMGDRLYTYATQRMAPRDRVEPAPSAAEKEPAGWVALDLRTGRLDLEDPVAALLNRPRVLASTSMIAATAEGLQLQVSLSEIGEGRAGAATEVHRIVAGSGTTDAVTIQAAAYAGSLGQLPTGEVLGIWSDVDYWNGLVGLAGLVLVEPEARDWRLPEGTCDGTGPSIYASRVMHLGDDAWILADDGGRAVLARVVIDG